MINSLKLLIGVVLLSLLLYADDDYYPDNVEGIHCSCELSHFCVQLGVYKNKANLQRAKARLKNEKSIILLTEEEVKMEDKIYYRLIAHSDIYFVTEEEAVKLLNTIKKSHQKVFPKAFIVKRFIMD